MGKKELGWSEAEVLASTPRKFFALMQCAEEYNKKKYSSKEEGSDDGVKDGYIDEVNW